MDDFVTVNITNVAVAPSAKPMWMKIVRQDGTVHEPDWRQDETGAWWAPVEAGDRVETISALDSTTAVIIGLPNG